jgi:hypothetical protein
MALPAACVFHKRPHRGAVAPLLSRCKEIDEAKATFANEPRLRPLRFG